MGGWTDGAMSPPSPMISEWWRCCAGSVEIEEGVNDEQSERVDRLGRVGLVVDRRQRGVMGRRMAVQAGRRAEQAKLEMVGGRKREGKEKIITSFLLCRARPSSIELLRFYFILRYPLDQAFTDTLTHTIRRRVRSPKPWATTLTVAAKGYKLGQNCWCCC